MRKSDPDVFGVGALALLAIGHYLVRLGARVTMVRGAIFVFCVLTIRRGIVGELMAYFNKRRQSP